MNGDFHFSKSRDGGVDVFSLRHATACEGGSGDVLCDMVKMSFPVK